MKTAITILVLAVTVYFAPMLAFWTLTLLCMASGMLGIAIALAATFTLKPLDYIHDMLVSFTRFRKYFQAKVESSIQ